MKKNLISYTKNKGEKPFNWNKFLNSKKTTDRQWYKAEDLASNWVTCACGSQCDIIPRNESGVPIDIKLEILGRRFYEVVMEQNKDAAKNILKEIEVRSARLIKEINNESKFN